MAGVYLYVAVLCGAVGLASAQSCQVADIEVQPNFDITRMIGRWYEIKWTAYTFVKEEYRFRDYEHWYFYNETTKGLDVKGHGRASVGAECFNYVGTLNPTPTPGKLLYTRPEIIDDTTKIITTPYWIISTDYDNYALSYYCSTITSNGTCHPSKTRSWVWGRKPQLSPADSRMMDSTIQSICVDPNSYLETPHGHECPMIDGTPSIHKTGYTLFVAVLSLWLIR